MIPQRRIQGLRKAKEMGKRKVKDESRGGRDERFGTKSVVYEKGMFGAIKRDSGDEDVASSMQKIKV